MQHSLSTLHGEIQDHVINSLTPFAALALRQVDRQFRRMVPSNVLNRKVGPYVPLGNLGQRYLHDIETSTWHPHKDGFACFGCMRFQPSSTFSIGQVRGKHGKNGKRWSDRRCPGCRPRNSAQPQVHSVYAWELADLDWFHNPDDKI